MHMHRHILIVLAVVLIALFGFFAFRRAEAPVPPMNDSVRIASPVSEALVSSPLAVSGEVRGMWFFEASFPLALLDADRKEVAQGYAQAGGEWMTEDFVPFSGTLDFTAPASDTGFLVFKKDNPSGDASRDASVEIPVRFR